MSPLLVTGIGSLPHESYDEAQAFVARWAPLAPWTPELPRLGIQHSMLGRFFTGMEDLLSITAGGVRLRPGVDPDLVLARLPLPAAPPIGRDTGTPPVSFPTAKLQIAGPLVTASALIQGGMFEVDRTKLIVACAARVTDLAGRTDIPRILQLDEPALTYSAPLFEEGSCILSGTRGGLEFVGWTVAVHDCGPLNPLAFSVPIIFFDALLNPPSPANIELTAHWCRRGRKLGLGIFPTDRITGPIECDAARHALTTWREALMAEQVPPDVIAYITATCGLGLSTVEIAESVFAALNELAQE